MKDLYGNEFLYQVAVATVLIIAFVFFLYLPKGAGTVRESRRNFRHTVLHTVACIGECTDHKELATYQDTATNVFLEYYSRVGEGLAMKGYNRMTRAIIERTQQLNTFNLEFNEEVNL